jgi:tetratricopeptide (TPR) repeat protein
MQLFIYTACVFWYNNHTACSGLDKYNEEYLRKLYELSYKYNFVDWLGWQGVSDLVVAAIRGNSSETENACNKLCELSKKMGRPYGVETWIHTWWGYYCVRRGAFDLAQKAATTIIQIEKQEVGAQIGYAQWIEIRILTEQGKIEEALPKLEEIVSLHRKHNLMPFGDSLLELAKLYIQIDRLKEADSLLKEAYKRVTSEEYWNVTQQAILYRVMGYLSLKEKNFKEAEKHFDESLKVAKENNNPIQEGFTYWAMGELFIESTQYDLAKEFLEEAAEKFKEIDNQYQLKKVQLAQDKLAESTTQEAR